MGGEVRAHHLEDAGSIPNHPHFPLLLYRDVLDLPADAAATVEEVLGSNGWGGTWRDGIYSFHHYHSTAHEVLGIARGKVEVLFGGEPGVTVTLQAGDAALLPAGTGHKNLGSSAELLVVGGYPPGQTPDLLRGETGERPGVDEAILETPLPGTDPIHGEGPMQTHWNPGPSG